MAIEVEKQNTLTVSEEDVQILMDLVELARVKMQDPGHSRHCWTDKQWFDMRNLMTTLFDAGLT